MISHIGSSATRTHCSFSKHKACSRHALNKQHAKQGNLVILWQHTPCRKRTRAVMLFIKHTASHAQVGFTIVLLWNKTSNSNHTRTDVSEHEAPLKGENGVVWCCILRICFLLSFFSQNTSLELCWHSPSDYFWGFSEEAVWKKFGKSELVKSEMCNESVWYSDIFWYSIYQLMV